MKSTASSEISEFVQRKDNREYNIKKITVKVLKEPICQPGNPEEGSHSHYCLCCSVRRKHSNTKANAL